MTAQPTGEGLIRAIRRWDLVAVAINGIIGAGIFGLPSEVFREIGPYSIFAFIACALVVTLIVLCFAEVSSRFSATGGPYLYAREAFGSWIGFEVGWLIWLARLTAFAANCNLLISYLGFFWPAIADPFWQTSLSIGGLSFSLALSWRVVVIILIVCALTIVNIAGVRDAALVSNFFTVGKLIPLALFIGAGLFFLNTQNFTLSAAPGIDEFSASVLILIYAFTGFEMAVIPAGEVRDPQRNLPMAILTAIGVVSVIYILIQIVSIGTFPMLGDSKTPLADASNQFLGSAGASIITIGAVVSIIGNLNVLILAGSRLPFAMAEQKELPSILAQTHKRFRTPHASIVLTSLLVLALTLSGTFIYAATISVIARLLGYAATCVALIVLRRKANAPEPMFRAPAGISLAIITLLLSAWLLSKTNLKQVRDSAIAAGIGLAVYAAYRVFSSRRRRKGNS
jgi:amino acid transporter